MSKDSHSNHNHHGNSHVHASEHAASRHAIRPRSDWIYPTHSDAARVIEWSQVSVDFEGREVISNVTSWIHQGELTCICGANGAGKTQLIRLGLGIVTPRVGRVTLLGGDPLKTRKRVGYVPQLKTFNRNYPATVEEVLVAALRGRWPLWIRRKERDLAAATLQSVGGITLLDKDVSVLSGGELQRVFMARALIGNPEILVLDEPMAAVDTKGRVGMFDLLAELRSQRSITIVLITHSDQIVTQLSDRVIFLERGRLVGWGRPQEVLSIDELRDVAFFGHDHEAAIHGGEG